MKKEQWQELGTALKKCLNSRGTFQYNYDGGFRLIEKYYPKNCICGLSPEKQDFETQNAEQSVAAVDNFVKAMMYREDTCICSNAQLLLGEDEQPAKDKIAVVMEAEKRLLVRAVANLDWHKRFPNEDECRSKQAEALFEVGCAAIEEFQKTPTALILFPDLVLPDSRVLGGFYGSPWSTKNGRSLKMKFRMLNPHFEMHLRSVYESSDYRDRRKIGVLFTYTNPW